MITILLIIVQIRDKHLREDLDYHMKMLEMLVILLTGVYQGLWSLRMWRTNCHSGYY